MSEYTDFACEDDLDPFMREVTPLEALRQDLTWMLRESRGSHVFDPEWGIGLEDYLGSPLPSNLDGTIEQAFERDDRVQSARCTISPLGQRGEAYAFSIEVQATDGFLLIALSIGETEPEAAAPVPVVGPPPVVPAPTVTSATSVPATGGTVTVTGTGFLPGAAITAPGLSIGATTLNSSTSLSAPVAAHAAGVFDVTVTQSSGTATLAGGLTVTAVLPAPTLTDAYAVNRSAAKAALTTGDTLDLIGTNFVTGAEYQIDGAGSWLAAVFGSSTVLTITTPAHAEGAGTLRVRNPDGQITATVAMYWVVSPATMNLTGWWEQRGDALDYSTADTDGAGPDVANVWEGRTSAGASGGRNHAVDGAAPLPPTRAGLVDGAAPLDLSSYRSMTTGLDRTNFGTSTAQVATFVDKILPTVNGMDPATPGSAGRIYTDFGYYLLTTGKHTDGITRIAAQMNANPPAIAVVANNQWNVTTVRWDGSTLEIWVNGTLEASAAATSSIPIGGAMRFDDTYWGNAFLDRLAILFQQSCTTGQVDSIYQYYKRYRYPSAGLP